MRIVLALIVAALIAPFVSSAQPIITQDWIGSPGDQIDADTVGQIPDPGPAGPDQFWDFSALPEDPATLPFSFLEPNQTPFFMDFPKSNLSISQSKLGIYGYDEVNASTYDNWGSVGPSTMTIYDDPITELTFPFTYEDSFDDDYSGIRTQNGVQTFITGKASVTADAYGTAEMPGGTFDDVVRVKMILESEDSTDLGLGIVEKILQTTTVYLWYSADHPGPLCIHETIEGLQIAIVEELPNDTLAFGPTSVFVFDPLATSSATQFFSESNFDLTVSTNPFVSQLNFDFTVERSGSMQLEIQTITGQTVFEREILATAGANSITIPTSDIPSGSYLAVLKNEEAGALTKLVKVD